MPHPGFDQIGDLAQIAHDLARRLNISKRMEPETTKPLRQMVNLAVTFVSHAEAYNHAGLKYHLNKMNEHLSQLTRLFGEFNNELIDDPPPASGSMT